MTILLCQIFLNEKYGNYWCPLVVDRDVFENMLKKVTEDNKKFLEKWYHLDETLDSPAYVLHAVEKHIPGYVEDTQDAYKEANREWEKLCIRLRNILLQAASPEFQKQYLVSGKYSWQTEITLSIFGTLLLQTCHSLKNRCQLAKHSFFSSFFLCPAHSPFPLMCSQSFGPLYPFPTSWCPLSVLAADVIYTPLATVPAQEKQMEEFLFTNRWTADNLIWLRRTFKKLDLDSGSCGLSDFVDMNGENFNENAQLRLKTLCGKVAERTKPENRVDSEVDWAAHGINRAEPQHAAYLVTLCNKYRQILKTALDRIMDRRQEQDRRRIKQVHRGELCYSQCLQNGLVHAASSRFSASPNPIAAISAARAARKGATLGWQYFFLPTL